MIGLLLVGRVFVQTISQLDVTTISLDEMPSFMAMNTPPPCVLRSFRYTFCWNSSGNISLLLISVDNHDSLPIITSGFGMVHTCF